MPAKGRNRKRKKRGGHTVGGPFLPFEEARAVVRKLELKGGAEWRRWRKSDARPSNIPSNPNQVYRDAGWVSLPDWLGCKPHAGGKWAGVKFLPFEEAREEARKLGLKSGKEWTRWRKNGGVRPINIPGAPYQVYRDDGWVSWPDWLGYKPHAGGKWAGISFLPFEEAREAARKLGLKSEKEWEQWRKTGARPYDIPGNPRITYRDSGWVSFPDWLGYEYRSVHRSSSNKQTSARRTKRKRIAPPLRSDAGSTPLANTRSTRRARSPNTNSSHTPRSSQRPRGNATHSSWKVDVIDGFTIESKETIADSDQKCASYRVVQTAWL